MPVRELAWLGIPVLVDGAQGAGAIPVDVGELGCDFYTVSGQKWLLGPDTTGGLYVRPDWLERLALTSASYLSWADPEELVPVADGAAVRVGLDFRPGRWPGCSRRSRSRRRRERSASSARAEAAARCRELVAGHGGGRDGGRPGDARRMAPRRAARRRGRAPRRARRRRPGAPADRAGSAPRAGSGRATRTSTGSPPGSRARRAARRTCASRTGGASPRRRRRSRSGATRSVRRARRAGPGG